MNHRIMKTATGWSLDGFAIQHGDAVRAYIGGEWRDAVFWTGDVAMIVQRIGAAGSEVVAGSPAEGVDVRWPDGTTRAKLN